jgi:hypothetical protein
MDMKRKEAIPVTSVATLMKSRFGRDAATMTDRARHDSLFIKGLAGARKRCLHKTKPDPWHLTLLNTQTLRENIAN